MKPEQDLKQLFPNDLDYPTADFYRQVDEQEPAQRDNSFWENMQAMFTRVTSHASEH